MSGSLGDLGFCFIISGSGGLNPSAVAGKPSVTKLTHSSCTGIRASGIPRAAVRKMLTTSPMFEDIKYLNSRMVAKLRYLNKRVLRQF